MTSVAFRFAPEMVPVSRWLIELSAVRVSLSGDLWVCRQQTSKKGRVG